MAAAAGASHPQAIAQGFGPSITDPAALRRFGALLLPVAGKRVAA